MSDTVIVAIITGAVALVSALSALGWKIYTWHLERRDSSVEKAFGRASTATRYTHTVDTIVVRTEILNAEGDSITDVRVNGVRVSHGITLNTIPMELLTTGTFSTETPPVLLEVSRTDVCFEAAMTTAQRYTCELKVYGGLQENDTPFDYAYRFSAKSGYLLTKEGIKERYGTETLPYEFLEETIAVPVKHIRIAIEFPKQYVLKSFPMVTIGDSPEIASDERRRLDAAFKVAGNGAALNLNAPKPGLRYLVCWDGTPSTSSA